MNKKPDKLIKTVIFIFTGFVLLGSYLVVIGGYQSFFMRVNHYKIVVDDSTGIFSGSYVTVNGMRVGNVSQLSLEEGKVFLTLRIKKRFTKFITQDSVASLKTRGLLGDRYISIETQEGAPALPAGSFIKTEGMGDVSGNKENDLLQNVTTLIDEISALVSQLNKDGKGVKLVQDVTKVSQQAQKLFSKNNIKHTQDILIHLKSILKKIDKGEGTLGAIVNDKELHNEAMSSLGKNAYSNILKYIFRKDRSAPKRGNALDEESTL